MTTIQELQKEIDLYKDIVNNIHSHFMKVITDKTIPIDDRWKLFVSAPSELRGHKEYYYTFSCFGGFEWYDDYGAERHQTINMIDFVNEVQGDVDQYIQTCSTDDLVYCFTEKLVKIPNVVDKIKEELMQANIGSFVFDW
jgi:hypothetical protein